MPLDWSRLSVRLNRVAGRVRCEAGWRLDFTPPTPGLPDCDLWLVWAGRGTMRTRTRTVVLRPGVCIWMRVGATYQATQAPADRLGVTFIHFDLLDRRQKPVHSDDALPPEVHEVPDLALADAVARRVVELTSGRRHQERPDPVATLAATELFTGLLMDIDRHTGAAAAPDLRGTQRHHHQVVTEIASRITESPGDVPSVARLAEGAGYSADHFARVFQSVLGRTPQQFIVQARIDRARQLLAESGLSVGQIAGALGYDSLFFFCRQFKQKTGLTPSQYRRTAPASRSN